MVVSVEKTGSDKYHKIIHAATKVFAERGFYNAKISDVAREADVADGTIYLYFKNKDDLLISIFEDTISTFIETVSVEMKKALGPVEKLRYFIQLHLDLVRKNQDVAQVLQIELRQSSKFMKEYAATKFKEYLDIIAHIIEEGQAAGVFKPSFNPLIVKRAIFGAIDEMALDWVLMKRKKYSTQDVAEQLSLMLVEGLKVEPTISQ